MAGALGAQPILQYGNVNLVGSNYDLYVVTDPGNSNPGVNGANVTWDFSSAVMVLAGTNSFVAPAGTPYAASFPASNLAAVVTHQDTTGYMYYSVSSSQLEILAEYVGTNDENVYTVPKSVLEFPFAFNDSFQDDYVDEDASNTVTRTYTGYGTVILPGGGTVADVVKTTSTSGSMAFFRSNPVAPLVSIEDDGDALRLAVKLDIDLIRESLDDVPSTPTHVKAQSWDLEFSASEALGDDHYAASRRAIVRAAAEIGKGMP